AFAATLEQRQRQGGPRHGLIVARHGARGRRRRPVRLGRFARGQFVWQPLRLVRHVVAGDDRQAKGREHEGRLRPHAKTSSIAAAQYCTNVAVTAPSTAPASVTGATPCRRRLGSTASISATG